MIKFVTTIILAAGESKRTGETKQLLLLGNLTIIERTIENYVNSNNREIILVIGHESKKITDLISNKPIKTIINTDYKKGMSTSIKSGLKFLNPKSEGVLLALADQPFVDTDTINQLINAFSQCEKGIIIPVYRKRRGNPILFSISYKDQLLNLRGDIGGREIVKIHSDDVYEVNVDCRGILIDIDTPNNYREALKKFK